MGALYGGQEISSPIHRTEQNFSAEDSTDYTASQRKHKFTRLAALASEINEREDDLSHPDYKRHRETVNSKAATPKKSAAPQPPKEKPAASPQKPVVSPRKAVPTKNLKWDSKVMSHLESQGFQRRETSTTKLVYDYAAKPQPEEPPKNRVEFREMPKQKAPAPKPPATSNVRDRAALFDKRKSIFAGRDPAELSIRDRMAIFEKNKGSAPLPVVPFSQNIPAQPAKPLPIQKPAGVQKFVDEAKVLSPKKTISDVAPDTRATGMGVLSTVASLLSKEPTISESKISQDTKKQRDQEMELLLNRYKKADEKPVPKAPPLPPADYLQSPGDSHSATKRRSGELPFDFCE